MDLPVRCEQKFAVAIVALTMGPAIAGGVAGLGVILLFGAGALEKFLGLGLIGGGAYFAFQMAENFSWVELEHRTLRGKRFWTRVVLEHELDDIASIVPMISGLSGLHGLLTDALLDQLLGAKNRGFVINFKNGPRFVLIRGDMKYVDELILALLRALGKDKFSEVLRLSDDKSDRNSFN